MTTTDEPDTGARGPRHGRPRRRPSFSLVLGEILLTVGVLAILFAFYESYWTNIDSGRKQEAASGRLDELWDQERVNPRQRLTPELGEAFARMYIPTFGSDFHFAVVEGTADADLLAGPGRYVDSQMPGEAGNFAVAGHRVGKGAPFNDLGELEACDAVVVETFSSWEVYRVLPMSQGSDSRRAEAAPCFSGGQVERMATGEYSEVLGRHITLPHNIEVINPLPGYVGTEVTAGAEPLLTLTTCHPQFSNEQRMIVHAMLVDSIDKAEGERPAVLEES